MYVFSCLCHNKRWLRRQDNNYTISTKATAPVLTSTLQKAKIRPKAFNFKVVGYIACGLSRAATNQISPLWELRQPILDKSPGRVWTWSIWNVIHRRKSLWTAVLAAGDSWWSDEVTILWHNHIHDCCTAEWYISIGTHLTSSRIIQCDQLPRWSSSHQILHVCSCFWFSFEAVAVVATPATLVLPANHNTVYHKRGPLSSLISYPSYNKFRQILA